MNAQLEFLSVLGVQERTAAAETRKQSRKAIQQADPAQFATAVLRSLNEEAVAYSTYTLMCAVDRAPEAPTITSLAESCGSSYHAIHKTLERTPWFEKLHTPTVCLTLTPEGREKIERVSRRISRHICS